MSASVSKKLVDSVRYTQVKVSVRPEVAAKFKASCQSAGLPVARVLSAFMSGYPEAKATKPEPVKTKERRQRRKAVRTAIDILNAVMLDEEAYHDNIPENLQGGVRYEESGESVCKLEEAISLLEEVYS